MPNHPITALVNREAETAVLGAVLHNPASLEHLRGYLRPEQFSSPGRRAVYEAMLSLAEQDKPIDEITVVSLLRTRNCLDTAGGPATLAEMVDLTPVTANVMIYAAEVIESWRARRTYEVLQEAAQHIGSAGVVNDELRALRTQLDAIDGAAAGAPVVPFKELLVRFYEWMEADRPAFLAKTWTAIDDRLGGISDARPLYLAALTSRGKTTFGMQTALRNAKHGIPTMVFLLEDDAVKIAGRAISAQAKIEGVRLLHKHLNALDAQDWDSMAEAAEVLSSIPLYVCTPKRPLWPAEIENITRQHIAKHNVQFVVVDHLDRLAATKGTIYDRQSERAEGMADMVTRLRMPVMVCAQINRKGVDDPDLHHLEGSGKIEQTASAAIVLADVLNDEGYVTAIKAKLAKNDSGPKGYTMLADKRNIFTID